MSDKKGLNDQLEAALEAEEAEKSAAAGKVAKETDKDVAPPSTAKAADPKTGSAKAPAKPAKPTPAKRQDTRQEAKDAQDKARKAAIAQAEAESPEPSDLSEKDLKEEKRREKIRERLAKAAEQIEELEKKIEKLKTEGRELMAELYPHQAGNDRHVDAVRNYLKASQKERQNRGAHPARLKELLEKAGRAPVDAAFARARYRGGGRPQRKPVGVGKSPAQDQAKDATPGSGE